MNQNLGVAFLSKLKDMLRVILVRCLHLINAIALRLNLRLNKIRELEMSLQKTKQPLSHDQLIKIAEGISVFLPDVLENVLSEAVTTPYEKVLIQRKLFVGGLGCHTTSEDVYGEIDEAVVARYRSGVSKECGFVTFTNVKSALMALKEPYKMINGKMTVAKIAKSRTRLHDSLRTVYVANVPYDMFPGKLLEHFSAYGEIEKGPFGFDKQTGKSKGYALLVYKTLKGAKTAISEASNVVDGHQLTCEMAIRKTKEEPISPNSGSLNCCNHGSGSMLGHGGSRPEASQAGSQYAPCQGNGHMYLQNCACGLVTNGGNTHGCSSPAVIGCKQSH